MQHKKSYSIHTSSMLQVRLCSILINRFKSCYIHTPNVLHKYENPPKMGATKSENMLKWVHISRFRLRGARQVDFKSGSQPNFPQLHYPARDLTWKSETGLCAVRALWLTSVNAETKFLQQNTLNQHKPKLKSKQKGEEVKIKMGRGNGMT